MNRPLRDDDEYDLDDVCVLRGLEKSTLTQKQLKELYGSEIMAYAKVNDMLKPVTEHTGAGVFSYSDHVNFHLDTLPCVPEDPHRSQQSSDSRRVKRVGPTVCRHHR